MILGTQLNSEDVHNRLNEVIEGFDVMALFTDASAKLGSDLVIFCDVETSKAGAMVRSQFVKDHLKDAGYLLWDELTDPAISYLPKDSLAQLAFWLIVAFSNEEVYCVATGAYLMQPGGDA